MAYSAFSCNEVRRMISDVEEIFCTANATCPGCGLTTTYYVVLMKEEPKKKEGKVGCKIKKKEVKKTKKK